MAMKQIACVYIHVCMYVYIHGHTHTHTHTHTHICTEVILLKKPGILLQLLWHTQVHYCNVEVSYIAKSFWNHKYLSNDMVV